MNKNLVVASGIVVLGVALAAAGIYIGDTDDAPGAALLGIGLMLGLVALAVKVARRKRPAAQAGRCRADEAEGRGLSAPDGCPIAFAGARGVPCKA